MPTVEAEIVRLFPSGTRDGTAGDDEATSWSEVPILPADVFAAAAHLLEASGAYQYIVAPFSATPPSDFGYVGPTFAPDQAELDRWCALGDAWRSDITVGMTVQPFWTDLLASRNEPLVVNPPTGAEAPAWWRSAHALLVISDEACRDLGYASLPTASPSGPLPLPWANQTAALVIDSMTARRVIPDRAHSGDDRHISRHVALDSLSFMVDRHVARVLPKGRTTEMGCAPRTFSHNLALLPPHGRANAYWHQSQAEVHPDPDLNLLLVPFPYVLPPRSFRGMENAPDPKGRRWGRFKIDQRWLSPATGVISPEAEGWSTPASVASFVAFVDALLAASAARGSPTNGIVLPSMRSTGRPTTLW